jgi:hypothetical protein
MASEYRSLQLGIDGFTKLSEVIQAFFAPELCVFVVSNKNV